LEREAEQLKDAGIWPDAPTAPGTAPAPDLSWMLADTAPERRPEHFGLRQPYGLLARHLVARGMDVAVIGGPGETELAAVIRGVEPAVKDLTGRTDYAQIA